MRAIGTPCQLSLLKGKRPSLWAQSLSDLQFPQLYMEMIKLKPRRICVRIGSDVYKAPRIVPGTGERSLINMKYHCC